MELRHLRYFVAVVEEQSFTRAAERLYVSQPPLSRQIRALEVEIGTELLNRQPGRVELTDAGRMFYKEACSILEHASRALANARAIAAGDEGEIRLGVMTAALYIPSVLKVLARFRIDHPKVKLVLTAMPYEQQLEALDDGQIDLALVYQGLVPEGRFASQLFSEGCIEFIFAKGHPLAARKDLQLKDLSGEPFVMPKRAELPIFYEKLTSAWKACELTPRIAAETDNFSSTALLVSSGIGISYADRHAAEAFGHILDIARVNDFDFSWGCELIWNPGAISPQVELLLPYIKN
jgi:DNA-binding transcriptional LysR family regulator